MAEIVRREDKASQIKITVFQYIIVLILVALVCGLWRLQILDASNYRVLAEQNRIRKVPILAPRGKIVDREGRLIVDSYPSTSCFLLPEYIRDLDADLPEIANGLHMSQDDIQAVIRKYRGQPKYQPIPLKQDITPDEVAFIEAHRNELPELETIDEQRRLYPKNGFAAHLIGYVGEVSEQMLDDPRYEFYQPGDVVGRSGVEQSYDELLRGTDGSRDVIVNSHGKELGLLGREPSIPGKTLRLTIDLDIQKAAEEALGNRNGAIIAEDPRTGEILALVSRPVFDPNLFAVHIHRADWNKLITDPDHPLMDKAIQAQLAPGSTFKILMAIAGLQEGIANDMHVHCSGGAMFYGRYFKCWISARHESHGDVDIHHAIPWSCDVFFYTLAERLGIDKIAEWGHRFGLGQKTGVDLPDEVAGTMPSEEWKMKYYHEKWYAGETISVGIGQGAIAATPIQMLRAIAGIASGGALKRPHVVPYDEMPPEMLAQLKTEGSGDVNIPITPGNWETVTDGMAAVTEPGGTAASAHLEGIDFAGKTGSAQTISNELKARMGGGGVKLRDNAWFVGVSPRRNPEIAVCILWENGMEGYFSARRAARVVEAYVEKQRRLEGNLRMAAAPTSPSPTQPSGTNPGPPRPTKAAPPADKPSDTAKLSSPSNKIEMAAIWSDSSTGAGKFTGGHFDLPASNTPDAATVTTPSAKNRRAHHVPPVAMAVR